MRPFFICDHLLNPRLQTTCTRLPLIHEKGDQSADCRKEDDEEEDFPEALRVIAGDFTGVAVDQDLVNFGAVAVSQQPDGCEDVFEGLFAVMGVDLQESMGVPGDIAGAHGADFSIHTITGFLSGSYQVDLVLFNRPARKETRVVRFQLFGREGFNFTQQVEIDPFGSGHKFVIEKMADGSRGSFPARMSFAACACVAI